MSLVGLPTNNAPFFMNLARARLAEHDHCTAYARANTAYQLLSQQN